MPPVLAHFMVRFVSQAIVVFEIVEVLERFVFEFAVTVRVRNFLRIVPVSSFAFTHTS